jgi:hypothetical protein
MTPGAADGLVCSKLQDSLLRDPVGWAQRQNITAENSKMNNHKD